MDPIIFMQKLLRILFYVFVVVTLVCYASERWYDWPNTYWVWCGLGAVGTSLIRFFLKFV